MYKAVPGEDPFLTVAHVLVDGESYGICLKREDNIVE